MDWTNQICFADNTTCRYEFFQPKLPTTAPIEVTQTTNFIWFYIIIALLFAYWFYKKPWTNMVAWYETWLAKRRLAQICRESHEYMKSLDRGRYEEPITDVCSMDYSDSEDLYDFSPRTVICCRFNIIRSCIHAVTTIYNESVWTVKQLKMDSCNLVISLVNRVIQYVMNKVNPTDDRPVLPVPQHAHRWRPKPIVKKRKFNYLKPMEVVKPQNGMDHDLEDEAKYLYALYHDYHQTCTLQGKIRKNPQLYFNPSELALLSKYEKLQRKVYPQPAGICTFYLEIY